jgi:hypothetical protein
VPQGNYFFCGAPLNGNNVNLLGVGSESRIFICDDQYLFSLNQVTARPSSVDGVAFVGGKGVFDSTTTGASTPPVSAIEWHNDFFYDFTGAEIAVETSDWPWWLVDHCIFQGLDFNNTIDLVLPGSSAIQILNSDFQRQRVAIKFFPTSTGGNNGNLVANDAFLGGDAYANAQKPRVGVWIVPDASANSGIGMVVENNKYGNEGLYSFDARNLWVTDASGPTESTRMPNMVTLDDAAIAGGTALLTSAGECPFTSAMCQGGSGCTGSANWGIVIQNAARAVGAVSDALTTTITGFTNSCTVTIANNASATVSGQVARTSPNLPTLTVIGGVHFVKNSIVGAGSYGSAPFIVSNANYVHDNDISYNTIYPGLPSELIEQLVVPGDPLKGSNLAIQNIAEGQLVGTNTIPPGQGILSNVAGWFDGKADPGQFFNHGGDDLSIPYPLTGDVGASVVTVARANGFTAENGATLVGSVTDSFGKNNGDAAEYSFASGGDLTNTISTVSNNVPVWIYFETHSGSSSSLNRLRMSLRDSNGAILFNAPMMVSSGWHPWLFKWIPNDKASGLFIAVRFEETWADGNDTGRVQIGRIRIYQGWTPPPMTDQNINGELNVNGNIRINGNTRIDATGDQLPVVAGIGGLTSCGSGVEGIHGVATNCNTACSAGATCTAGGAIHCEVYCNGTAYVETGR